MTAELTQEQKALFDEANFATVATINPDGQPQLSVVWVETDGPDILFSTTVGRIKERNLRRDPRVTILVNPPANPYSYVEVRGTVEITEQGGRQLIDELAGKYMGIDRYTFDDGTDNVRVVVRIKPARIVTMG
ncbi:MAG: PPOX class F420-dependent oxidoreductase [Actinomycetes bacterium]